MKLWTIQPISVYNELIRQGKIFMHIDFVDENFKEAYQWMIGQMNIKISPAPSNKYSPIWAWNQYNGENAKKPDLRSSGYLPKGTKGVRIEFHKPDKEVLLSDYNLWHYVLNYWCIHDNEDQDKLFDHLLKSYRVEFGDKEKYPDNIRSIIEKSWLKIFDMQYDSDYSTNKFENKAIQATLWSLKSSEISKVDFFKAR